MHTCTCIRSGSKDPTVIYSQYHFTTSLHPEVYKKCTINSHTVVVHYCSTIILLIDELAAWNMSGVQYTTIDQRKTVILFKKQYTLSFPLLSTSKLYYPSFQNTGQTSLKIFLIPRRKESAAIILTILVDKSGRRVHVEKVCCLTMHPTTNHIIAPFVRESFYSSFFSLYKNNNLTWLGTYLTSQEEQPCLRY